MNSSGTFNKSNGIYQFICPLYHLIFSRENNYWIAFYFQWSNFDVLFLSGHRPLDNLWTLWNLVITISIANFLHSLFLIEFYSWSGFISRELLVFKDLLNLTFCVRSTWLLHLSHLYHPINIPVLVHLFEFSCLWTNLDCAFAFFIILKSCCHLWTNNV